MKTTAYYDGQDVLEDDLQFDGDGVRERVLDNASDVFGENSGFTSGGLVSGGAVTVNGGNPLYVDVTEAMGYCADGERFDLTAQTAVVIPDLTGGNNYLVASYTQFQDTPETHPVTSVIYNTRNQEQVQLVILSSYTPGQVNGQGHTYVPLALVTSAGPFGPLTIQDLRVFPKNLGPNTVNTSQIVNNAVIASKLADYLKPIVWTQLPDIYFSKDTNQLISRIAGSFNLTGIAGAISMAGFPVAVTTPITQDQILIGTISSNVCTVSLVALSTFVDFSYVSKIGSVVLGFLSQSGIFINTQSAENDEVVGLAEEEANSAMARVKAIENIWRRMNEGFQSFTPSFIEVAGVMTSNASGNLVTNPSANNLQVAAGVSYVAGRRLNIVAPIILSALNTEQFAFLAGTNTFDIWVLRIQSTGQYRFRVQVTGTALLSGELGYKLATVPVISGTPGVIIDTRVFSPNPEAAVIYDASQSVKIGARLRNMTDPSVIGHVIMVEPGTIGFADGTVRQNLVSKTIDFSTFQAAPLQLASQSLATGYLQSSQGGSPTYLEPFSHYAIFATADHPGEDFNIVAVKVPFFRSVNSVNSGGGVTYTGTVPGNFDWRKLFYPGQKIRATRADYTGPQGNGSNPPLTEFTNDNAVTPETIMSVTANSVTTSTGVPLAVFTGGTLTVLNKFRPDPTLTGISGRYRLLGFVSTEGTSIPNTLLKLFNQEGDAVVLVLNGNVSSKVGSSAVGTSGSATMDWNLDMQPFIPTCVKNVKIEAMINYQQRNSSYGGADATAGPGDGSGFTLFMSLQAPSNATPGGNTTGWIFSASAAGMIEVKVYMGFIRFHIDFSTGQFCGMEGESLFAIGYRFDAKTEWCLQTIVSGVGGFVS
jgi:hypothetical protein